MKLILVNGKKRSGKDYFAELLKFQLEKEGKVAAVMSFADPLKDIIADTFEISAEDLDEFKNAPESYKIDIPTTTPAIYTETDFRKVLQRFGTEAMKKWFGEDVWVELLINRAQNSEAEYIIVPDFRFFSEAIPGAVTIKIKNDDVDNSGDVHRSETELDTFEFQHVIDNTGYRDISDDARFIAKVILGTSGS